MGCAPADRQREDRDRRTFERRELERFIAAGREEART
jgi:hypothetical protein